MIKFFCHQIIIWICKKNHTSFVKAINNPANAQGDILYSLTGSRDYEKFINNFPVTDYSDWRKSIEERRVTEKKITQFIPTSGSTHKIKWIPYTKNFKLELWKATAPWLYDTYKRYPEIKNGTHFWSLSWLPENMRHEYQVNDLDFFVGLEKVFLEQIMTLPASASIATTLEDSMREALCSLINKKVTLISIWSPTFLLELLNFLIKEKDYFINKVDARTKDILLRHQVLSSAFTKELFPELVLLSAWATSTSIYYANILKDLFPHASFEAKGLWSTEGAVTIPYYGQFPIAVNSHFYEFIIYDSKKIVPSWKLEIGMKVSPLLTTGSGLIRYQLNDLLLVDGFVKSTPSLKFLGRINEVDLVGEKISSESAQEILSIISSEFTSKAISLLAFVEPYAHYMLLIEGKCNDEMLKKIGFRVEELLGQNLHYKLARELQQLGVCQVLCSENAMAEYIRYCEKQVVIRGAIKIEPLLLVRGSQND